jgi:hypothetical protein
MTTTSSPASSTAGSSSLFPMNSGSASNPVPSSSLYSIVHQPIFSDVIILVPLILALLLGAVLYRLTTKPQEAE